MNLLAHLKSTGIIGVQKLQWSLNNEFHDFPTNWTYITTKCYKSKISIKISKINEQKNKTNHQYVHTVANSSNHKDRRSNMNDNSQTVLWCLMQCRRDVLSDVKRAGSSTGKSKWHTERINKNTRNDIEISNLVYLHRLSLKPRSERWNGALDSIFSYLKPHTFFQTPRTRQLLHFAKNQ